MPSQFPISNPCPFERTKELGVVNYAMDLPIAKIITPNIQVA
jgi:hypothetical protein